MSGLTAHIRSLGGVAVPSPTNGQALIFNSASGLWVNQTIGNPTVTLIGAPITVLAGAFTDVDVTSSLTLVLNASVCEHGAPTTYFDLWELLWRTTNTGPTNGHAIGAGVTTFIGTPPAAPGVSGRIRFRLYNRDAVDHDLRIFFVAL